MAVEHPAVFERQMKVVSIFGGQPMLELDEAGLSAGSDFDVIWNLAETTRANFY